MGYISPRGHKELDTTERLHFHFLSLSHHVPKCQSLSRVEPFVTPWAVAHQAPLSLEFCRQEYWSGLPFPSPGDLPNPGIKPKSPAW